jgi:hypothetical protein
VDRVLAVPPPFFARCPIFRNQLSHFENRTEPASQIPEEGWSTRSLEWERGCRGSGSNARPPVKELARWTTRPHQQPVRSDITKNFWLRQVWHNNATDATETFGSASIPYNTSTQRRSQGKLGWGLSGQDAPPSVFKEKKRIKIKTDPLEKNRFNPKYCNSTHCGITLLNAINSLFYE